MKTQKNNVSELHLPKLLGRVSGSKYFIKNFLLIMGVIFLMCLGFALITYRQSSNILTNEFTAASQYRLEATARAIDNHLMDMRYIVATLDTNQMVHAFFAYPNPQLIYDDIFGKIQENLKAYVNGYSSIDSIYLYSSVSNTILTSTERTTIPYFSDSNWLEEFPETHNSFRFFFRAKNNAYPYMLCVMKYIQVNGQDAAIVLNLNLPNLSYLAEVSAEPYQEIFLVSDDSDILFRNRQRELTEPLDTVPELVNYQTDTDFYSLLVADEKDPYTYTQIHSEDYPWNYVMITHLHEYTSRLSDSRALFTTLLFALFCAALLLAFLFSLRSIRPIQDLINLLQNPQGRLSKELYSDKEISYLADQITTYIQQNQALSDELTARLNLLNEAKIMALQSQINPHFLFNTLNMIHILESEALGYESEVPKITLNLSRLLRYAIESTDLVRLDTELNFTKMYISILLQRYGNKLHVEYDIEDEVLSAKVPKLFIQPVIENAIFHGLAEHMNENSTLTLSCRKAREYCVVTVSDNGVGMSQETLEQLRETLDGGVPSGRSIGLKNIVTRMNLLYGEAFSLTIDSTPGNGSSFSMRFPLILNT